MHNNLNTQQLSTRKQSGMTFLGLLIIVALLVFIAIVGMKIMPAYIEFMAVKKVIHAMGQDQLSEMSKNQITESFYKRTSIDNIESIKAEDLVIEKNDVGWSLLPPLVR